jgi:hypothetical protein
MPKSFLFYPMQQQQQLEGLSVVIFIFLGYDYLFFFFYQKRIFCQKGAAQLLLARCVSVCVFKCVYCAPCWPTTRMEHLKSKTKQIETTKEWEKEKLSRNFHFVLSINPTSLANASADVNHPLAY